MTRPTLLLAAALALGGTGCSGCESEASDDFDASTSLDGAPPEAATDGNPPETGGDAPLDAPLDASLDAPPAGPTRFISPDGDDTADGSAEAPWRTFAFAIPKLGPGFTLVLEDGVYETATTGLPLVSCGPAASGTAEQPITLRAENERRAHLSADGTSPALRLSGCSYWTLEGLHGSSKDAVHSGPPPHVFDIDGSDHIVARRLLAHHTNRRTNSHAIAVDYSTNVLVEESEVYWYHRWGLIAYESDRVTFRRCTAHSRGHADIPGYASITADRGDFGIGLYQGEAGTKRSLVENCVSEDNGADFRSGRNPAPSGSNEPNADWNRFLGDIAIGNGNGMVRDYTAGAETDAGKELAVSYDTLYENVVVVGSANHGIFLRGGRNLVVRNATITGSGNDGFQADNVHDIVSPSVYLTNVLAFDNAWLGLNVSSDFLGSVGRAFAITHSATNDGFAPSEPIGDDAGDIRSSLALGPATMGLSGAGCVVYVPASETALKGKGAGGADIGANVVYRYQDGALTSEKLWGPSGFPCGAIVEGVNDLPGSSCRNLHERLNLGPGKCPLP